MKNKTAMAELIEKLKEKQKTCNLIGGAGIEMAIRYATELLETEKQQIIDAYFNGCKDVSTRDYEDAELYYTQTLTH